MPQFRDTVLASTIIFTTCMILEIINSLLF